MVTLFSHVCVSQRDIQGEIISCLEIKMQKHHNGNTATDIQFPWSLQDFTDIKKEFNTTRLFPYLPLPNMLCQHFSVSKDYSGHYIPIHILNLWCTSPHTPLNIVPLNDSYLLTDLFHNLSFKSTCRSALEKNAVCERFELGTYSTYMLCTVASEKTAFARKIFLMVTE